MPVPCTPTGEERWTGDWEYVGAVPQDVQSGMGPGLAAGIAMRVTYIWRREFEKEYVCCPGNQQIKIWVGGNYAVFAEDSYAAGIPVRTVAVGLPIPGPLGQLADLLGANINLGVWWEDEALADGERGSGPSGDARGNGPDKLAGAPQAECGQYVLLPDGTNVPWYEFAGPAPPASSSGEEERPEPPRRREEPPGCCDGLDWQQRRPKVEIRTMSLTREASGWFLELDVQVSHVCELAERPRHTLKLLAASGATLVDLTGLNPPPVSAKWQAQPRTWRYRAEHQQLPIPPAGPNPFFQLRFVAVSKCNGITEYVLKLAAT